MVKKSVAPDRGDLIWIDFGPAVGHEQHGRRPALVISPYSYNQKIGLLLACPITSTVRGFMMEVALEHGKIKGVVLVDQVKSLDWTVRPVETIGIVPSEVVEEVLAKLRAILE